MVAYSIFLNFVEVFTLTAFVYLYYSFSNKKTFVLLFCCLLFGFEICDILRENGIVLMSFNELVLIFCHMQNIIMGKKKQATDFLWLFIFRHFRDVRLLF